MYELLIDELIADDLKSWLGDEMSVSARTVRERLDAFPAGERELRIVIDSPGGDVFEGIAIFNAIRDFMRSHPDVKATAYIQGMAASMASVIALAAWSADPGRCKIEVEDNAVFMIHDAWDCVCGDKNELRAVADFLEQIDAVLRAVYVRRTGKSDAEIRAMMDVETWMWGREILEAGFADSVIECEPEEGERVADGEDRPAAADRDFFVRGAKQKFDRTISAVQKPARFSLVPNVAAAIVDFGELAAFKVAGGLPPAGKIKGGGMEISIEGLKKENPDVYAAVLAEGEAAGVRKEQARAARLLAMGEKAGCADYALECIRSGADPADAAVVDAFMDKGAAARVLAAQAEDEKNIPAVTPPQNSVNADADAMYAAFDKALKKGGCEYGDD